MDDAGALSGDDGLAHPVQSRRVFLELRQQGGREIVSCLVRKDRIAEIDEGAGVGDSFPCSMKYDSPPIPSRSVWLVMAISIRSMLVG